MPAGEKRKEEQFFIAADENKNAESYRGWCRSWLLYKRSSIIDSDSVDLVE